MRRQLPRFTPAAAMRADICLFFCRYLRATAAAMPCRHCYAHDTRFFVIETTDRMREGFFALAAARRRCYVIYAPTPRHVLLRHATACRRCMPYSCLRYAAAYVTMVPTPIQRLIDAAAAILPLRCCAAQRFTRLLFTRYDAAGACARYVYARR